MNTTSYRLHKLFVATALFLTSTMVFGQEAKQKSDQTKSATKQVAEKVGRPDIPGDLMIEFGFNWVQDHPTGYGFNTIGSRTFNAYYLYEMNLGESAFSFHPGIGIGSEKYAFADNYTLGYGLDSIGNNQLEFVHLDSIYGGGVSYKKSQINPNYLDIPFELRWRLKKYDPKRSFKIVVGGKVGWNFDSKTKVKYHADGETKITKQKENWQLNNFRYGVYGRLGLGGFSAFYYYSLSDLFRKDKGPMGTTMYPMTFGLSLALF